MRIRQDAEDLPVDLEAVEQVGQVGEVGRGGVLPVDVQPDEAFGVDGAAVYFGDVDWVDVGEAGADEGEGGVVVCVVEGGAVGVGVGDVDVREGRGGVGVERGVERHGCCGWWGGICFLGVYLTA